MLAVPAIFAVAVLVATLTSAFAASERQKPVATTSTIKPLGSHYLMLVNTAIASMMTDEKLAEFEKSPYDGLAVAFWHAYDTSPAISSEAMVAQVNKWKRSTSKDLWPWVYVNRMIGVDPQSTNPYSKDPYFHQFAGADLQDHAGAQTDFLQNWRNALRAARLTASPGIVCDLEFYNFYKEYDVSELALQTNHTPSRTVDLLRSLGARMARVAASEYPSATLWFLFTGFTHPSYKTIAGQPYYPSPSYVAMGLLDEIKNQNLPLKVISGGEGSLAYCHASLEQLRSAIKDREVSFAPHVERYRGILELAGTMTLYSDRSEMRDWVKTDCSSSEAAKLEDLQPYLELLIKTYRYNWIYASSDGGYLAFLPQVANRFNNLIRKAESQAGH